MKLKFCCFLFIGLYVINCNLAENLEDNDDDVTITTEEDSSTVDIPYESPTPADPAKVYLAEHFDDAEIFRKRWVQSKAMKEGISEDIAKYDGKWLIEPPLKDGLQGDQGLVLKSKAKHAAIASSLLTPFVFDKKPLIVQYEVMFQDGQECGGAYLKLLAEGMSRDLEKFHDKTPYSIMFGPDKCGNDHKLHFIFKHRNPLNGSVEEKHCKKPKDRLDEVFSDKVPHLYTLALYPDNTFEISVDKKVVNSGSLLEDFTPPVNPPREIDDPNDKKPQDWDEREKIADPDAVKPEDWDEDAPAQIVDEDAKMPEGWLEDEPAHIPDPEAKKPIDWDSEMDGEWEAPLIDNPICSQAPGCGPWEPPLINNPAFKGKWRAPLIDNPNYKGKWRPKRIPNPDFFEDKEPFKMQTITAVGFELWSMSKDILFDNIIISDDLIVVDQWAKNTFDKKRQKIDRDSESVIQKLASLTNDYPMLWLVYIIILGIPVVFVLYFCCKPGTSASRTQEKEEIRRMAAKKKTDDLTEETIKEEPNITKESLETTNNDDEPDIEDVEEAEEDEQDNDNDDDDDNDDGKDVDIIEDVDEEIEKVETQPEVKGEGGTRKRKVRKE